MNSIENNVDMSWDIGLGCIVLILYIVGKVWMYYNTDRDTKESKGVIRRGKEWD